MHPLQSTIISFIDHDHDQLNHELNHDQLNHELNHDQLNHELNHDQLNHDQLKQELNHELEHGDRSGGLEHHAWSVVHELNHDLKRDWSADLNVPQLEERSTSLLQVQQPAGEGDLKKKLEFVLYLPEAS